MYVDEFKQCELFILQIYVLLRSKLYFNPICDLVLNLECVPADWSLLEGDSGNPPAQVSQGHDLPTLHLHEICQAGVKQPNSQKIQEYIDLDNIFLIFS